MHTDLLKHLEAAVDLIDGPTAHRWSSGSCHNFAVALGRFLVAAGMPLQALAVHVAQRDAFDGGDWREIFSHAVLGVQHAPGHTTFIDCFGGNAIEAWESKFAYCEFQLPEDERSVFSWTAFGLMETHAISEHVAAIDGSMPLDPLEIQQACSLLAELWTRAEAIEIASEPTANGCGVAMA